MCHLRRRGLVASFFIAPAVVFLTTAGQAALFGLAFTYMWRAESALSLLQARLVKMQSQYKKTRLDLKRSNRASESLRKLERKREELLSRDDLTPADRFQLLELGNQCADLRTGLEQDRVKIKRRLDVLEQLGNRDRWTKSEADMTATRFYRNAPRLSDWGHDTRSRKLVSTVIRTLSLFAIVAALGVPLFTGTIWLPAQEYVPFHGREISGYTLAQTPAAETIMTDVRREVIVIPVKGIRTQYLCQEGSSATSQTLYQLWLAHGGRPSYPACRGRVVSPSISWRDSGSLDVLGAHSGFNHADRQPLDGMFQSSSRLLTSSPSETNPHRRCVSGRGDTCGPTAGRRQAGGRADYTH